MASINLHQRIIIFSLCYLIAILLVSNWYTFRKETQSRQRLNEFTSILSGAPEKLQHEVEKAYLDFFITNSKAAADIMHDAQTFQTISSASEQQILQLARDREEKYRKIREQNLTLSEEVLSLLELDHRLIKSFKDYANIQNMHRTRLINKIEPMANPE